MAEVEFKCQLSINSVKSSLLCLPSGGFSINILSISKVEKFGHIRSHCQISVISWSVKYYTQTQSGEVKKFSIISGKNASDSPVRFQPPTERLAREGEGGGGEEGVGRWGGPRRQLLLMTRRCYSTSPFLLNVCRFFLQLAFVLSFDKRSISRPPPCPVSHVMGIK